MTHNVFFVSDTHFGHKNILTFSPLRGEIKTIEQHDDILVQAWNTVVNPNDTVYHLGDVAFSQKALGNIARCNGHKHLIKGNHDNFPIQSYVDVGFNKIEGVMRYKEFVLTHVPIHPDCLEYRWGKNLHGHIHFEEDNIKDDRYLNLNMDVHGFAPIPLESVRAMFKSRETPKMADLFPKDFALA